MQPTHSLNPRLGVLAAAVLLAACSTQDKPTETKTSAGTVTIPTANAAGAASQNATAFVPPSEDQIPNNAFGDMVRLGKNIFVNTQVYAKGYVGNGLNCVNCHLDAGRRANSAPLWAAWVKYPAYREKNHKVNTYQDRLAGCFRFSENGHPPPLDSKEMTALVAYSYWMAKGAPTGVKMPGAGFPKLPPPAQKPDVRRGAQVFAQNCALCHGADGKGAKVGDRYQFPPLWGRDSYNRGAGMSRVDTAAAFIKANMPLGKGGSLSLQDAWDVAQYIDSQDRPADPRKKQTAG